MIDHEAYNVPSAPHIELVGTQDDAEISKAKSECFSALAMGGRLIKKVGSAEVLSAHCLSHGLVLHHHFLSISLSWA